LILLAKSPIQFKWDVNELGHLHYEHNSVVLRRLPKNNLSMGAIQTALWTRSI